MIVKVLVGMALLCKQGRGVGEGFVRQKGEVFRHEEELELENSFDFGKKIRFKSELDNFYINGH